MMQHVSHIGLAAEIDMQKVPVTLRHVSQRWTPLLEPPADKHGTEEIGGYEYHWDYWRECAVRSRARLVQRAINLSVRGSDAGDETLETYREERGNAQALELVKRVVADGSYAGWLWGPIGVGKSHLSKSVVKAARAAGIPAIYTTVAFMLDAIRHSYDSVGDLNDAWLIECYSEVPVLAIDDVGKETLVNAKGYPWGGKTLWDVINARVELRLPVFVTSNRSREETAALYAAKMAEANPPDPDLGVAIIDRLLQMAGGDANEIEIRGFSQRGHGFA